VLDKTTIWFIFIYGLIILGLGCLGYVEAGSKASLYSGLGFGLLLILSALSLFSGRTVGAYVSLGATILLTGVFSYRYSATGKGLPAILAVLSGAMLLFLLIRYAKWRSN
jgi:uncharacterized membrane protein (UPF0136 family)